MNWSHRDARMRNGAPFPPRGGLRRAMIPETCFGAGGTNAPEWERGRVRTGLAVRTCLILMALLAPSLETPRRAWSAPTVVQESMPDPALRQATPGTVTRQPGQAEPSVTYSSEGNDSTPPSPGTPLRMGPKPAKASLPLELDALARGWDKLNAGDPAQALASFDKAARSVDALVAREALMGKGYALWRLGREDQAEAIFKQLVDQEFRVPEVLPNLLFLLHKRGGPKAVAPYLDLLPESERDIWRK